MTQTRSAARRLRDDYFASQASSVTSDISAKFSSRAPFANALAPLLLVCAASAAQRGDAGAQTPTLPNYDAWGNMEIDTDFEPLDPEEGLDSGPILFDPDGMPLDPRDGSRLYNSMDENHLFDYYDNTPLDPSTGERLYTYRTGLSPESAITVY